MPHTQKTWDSGLTALGSKPSDIQLEQLQKYIELLDLWNKIYNLTSVREPADMIPLHIFDSLVVADHIQGKNCLDVGSGAGLPTIPLAIMQTERQFTALDTNGKKTRFIQQAAIELGLKNVTVEQSRIESWHTEHKFDAIISRAFSSVNDFVNSSSAHLAEKGLFYAMKGQYPEEELSTLAKDFKLEKTHKLDVPFVDGKRHLLEISHKKPNKT